MAYADRKTRKVVLLLPLLPQKILYLGAEMSEGVSAKGDQQHQIKGVPITIYKIFLSVTTPSTTGTCYQPAPMMQNATKTENATHVVYQCDDGFELPDGNTTITWECGCAALANLEPCLPRKYQIPDSSP